MFADRSRRHDSRLPDLIARLHRPDFFFVNIGANDGVSNDPIYPFLRRYRWSGIAVEPLAYVCDQLRRHYAEFPDVIVEHAAITTRPRPLYYVAPEATDAPFIRQTASLEVGYVEKTIALMRMYEWQGPVAPDIEDAIRRVEVPCLTFDELVERHRVRRIDFLNIDAEQSDFEILMAADLGRWRPAVLCLETSEFDPDQQVAVQALLQRYGYEVLERYDLFSEIFVRSEHVGRC